MANGLSCGVAIPEEILDGKKIFVADCIELGISDFGETIDDVLNNLRSGIRLLLEEAPEKTSLLEKEEPILLTRVFL